MQQTLAVKHRPKTFTNVIGQDYIVEVLENQIKNNNIGKSYLFAGPSGIGKTTVARIFASKIDSEVIEIDAASNNGVENVRHINDNVKYKPLHNKHKVYIIDECHMLSRGAWNALLKTLEEPPAHAVFILATTEPHKVIPTIVSRSQRFNFTRPSKELIGDNLLKIVEEDGYDVPMEVLSYIARLSEGGVRSSITMLESCLNVATDLDVPTVENILGQIPTKYFIDLIWEASIGNKSGVVELIDKYHANGVDFTKFIENLVMFMLDLEKYVITRDMRYLRTSKMYEDDIRGILNNMVNMVNADVYALQKRLNNMQRKVTALYYDSQKLDPKKYLLEATMLNISETKN